MPFVLEVIAGPKTGGRIELPENEPVVVGSGTACNFALSGDDAVSRSHFVLRAQAGVCTIADLASTNGTWVNGVRVESVVLAPGDRIRIGVSELTIKTKQPSGTFGNWHLPEVPQGWDVLPGQGLKRSAEGKRSNVVFAEEVLQHVDMAAYIERQRTFIVEMLRSPAVSTPQSVVLGYLGLATALDVTLTGRSGERGIQRQLYVQRGPCCGTITMTTVPAEQDEVRADLTMILETVRFEPPS